MGMVKGGPRVRLKGWLRGVEQVVSCFGGVSKGASRYPGASAQARRGIFYCLT